MTTEVGYLVSPINRQTGCTQFSSSVVGGPTTTVLPVCSLFLCNDNCTTGNITYDIPTIADFYGKRVVILKTVATAGFKIRITAPINFITTGSTTLNLPDAASVTELIFPITAGGVIGTDLYDGVVPTSTNIYNTSGTLTAGRVVTLGGFNLNISGTGGVSIIPTGTVNITPTGALNLGYTIATTGIAIGGSGSMPITMNGDVRLVSAPSVSTPDELVTYNTATKSLGHVLVSAYFMNQIFSMGMSTPSTSVAEACSAGLTRQFPNALSGAPVLSTTSPSGHVGYDLSGGLLNTTTGRYLVNPYPSAGGYYEVVFKIDYKCTTEAPNLSLVLRDTTISSDINTTNYNGIGAINQYSTFYLTDRVYIAALHSVAFLIVCNNTTGNFQVSNAFISINKI